MFKFRHLIVVPAAALLVLAACGGDPGAGKATGGGAARTVEIKALDTLRFEPASITAQAGEKIRFVVTNVGKVAHEFVLGDEQTQMAHEEQSTSGMDHMAMEAMASVALMAGETNEVTVTFDERATIPFGCHEPGHYPGGMMGTVVVS